MAIQCRAKDPSECRVHGTNGKWDRLQRVADHAAKIGDYDLYSQTRAEMDSLKDDEPATASAFMFSEDAVEAAAAVKWPPSGFQKVSSDVRNLALKDARRKLEIAVPYLIKGRVTTAAITAVAKDSWESRSNVPWNRASSFDRDSYMHLSQRFLKAAEPHMH